MKWAYVLAVACTSAACGAGAAPEATAPAPEAAPAAAAAAPAPAPAPAAAPARAAAKPAAPVSATPAAPVSREVTLPIGTMLDLDLATAVASDTSNVEDPVRATLREDIRLDGRTVLPAGTELIGTVTRVERSGRVKGRAQVAYEFITVRIGNQRYTVSTAPVAHEAEATKGQDAAKIGIGAGAGAALGGILGGGSGAAKGAAIGGAAGTGVVLATRGKEVRLEPGTGVTTSLTAPLTVRVRG